MGSFKRLQEKIDHVADAELVAAKAERDAAIKYWSAQNDKGLVASAQADYIARADAVNLAKQGEIAEAWNLMKSLDTYLRDSITDDFWDMMDELDDFLRE